MAASCNELFDCCDCGGNDCGCPACWSCHCCESCEDYTDWDSTDNKNPNCENANYNE